MRRVIIETETVGQAFGSCAVIRDMQGRRLEATETYPYGHCAAARARAEAIANDHGWVVSDDEATR